MEHRPIAGFDGYTVTDSGEVWSWWPNNGGKARTVADCPIRRLSPGIAGSNGYEQVWLYRNGERRGRLVHVLVLEAFKGPRPMGLEARHLDGNERNNTATNLAWGTAIENAADKARHGRQLRGEQIAQAKLTEADVLRIREFAADGVSYVELAVRFGVYRSTIRRAVIGERWAHVGGAR